MTIWQRNDFRQAVGETLRPGGLELTRRGLALCREHCGLAPDARILDLGCGPGATLCLLEGEGYRAFGLDMCPVPCRAGVVVRADAAHPPFAEAVMDAAICECVLSLFFPPLEALKRICRVLRPGGALLLTDFYVPEHPAWAWSADRLRAGTCLDGVRPVAEWQELLDQSGFWLRIFEDHSSGLAELAARLVWYGQKELADAFGLPCGGARHGRYGYGLWVAQKR